MREDELNSAEATVFSFLVITTYFIIPPYVILPAMGSCVAIAITTIKLRFHLGKIIKLVFVWCTFVVLVALGRFLGGTSLDELIGQGAHSISLFLSISTVLFIWGSVPADQLLQALDACRVRRSISYTFLSLITLIDSVKSLGERQLDSLRLKGLVASGLLGRIRCYWRLLGPLFSVLLSRQLLQVRSLYYRRFFSSRYKYKRGVLIIRRSSISTIILLTSNVALWKGISWWIW
jgi:hypothetical protein